LREVRQRLASFNFARCASECDTFTVERGNQIVAEYVTAQYLGTGSANISWVNFDRVQSVAESMLEESMSSNHEIGVLFGMIHRLIPTLPYHELVLQRKQRASARLKPLPSTRIKDGKPSFPFFNYVSSYFEELVENTREDLLKDAAGMVAKDGEENAIVAVIEPEACFECALRTIGQLEDDTASETRRSLIKTVMEACEGGRSVLYDRYVCQFVEWKVGCDAKPIILLWLQGHAKDLKAEKTSLPFMWLHGCFNMT
jgi:hypothetical protein